MFTSEVSYSLLLLHFHCREHVSACFHSAFYKADFRLCQDPFPLLHFMIFPFSWLRPFFWLISHVGCCVSFQGDREEPKHHLSYCSICTAAIAQQLSGQQDWSH